jgi:hypothetical protein
MLHAMVYGSVRHACCIVFRRLCCCHSTWFGIALRHPGVARRASCMACCVLLPQHLVWDCVEECRAAHHAHCFAVCTSRKLCCCHGMLGIAMGHARAAQHACHAAALYQSTTLRHSTWSGIVVRRAGLQDLHATLLDIVVTVRLPQHMIWDCVEACVAAKRALRPAARRVSDTATATTHGLGSCRGVCRARTVHWCVSC